MKYETALLLIGGAIGLGGLVGAACSQPCREKLPGYDEFMRECMSHVSTIVYGNGSTRNPCYERADQLGLTRACGGGK